MSELFRVLSDSRQANQQALDAIGRYYAPILGLVTNNNDPDNRRRVKVADPANPALETAWIRPIRGESSVDTIMPNVGATVIVWFIDGDPTKGWYLPVGNDTNPPFDKEDVQGDRYQNVPKDSFSQVGRDRTDRTSRDAVAEVGRDDLREVLRFIDYKSNVSITLRLENGASIELTPAGGIVFTTAWGAKLEFGTGGSGQEITWDFNGASVNCINVNDFTINGASIAVVGAEDSDNDILIDRGY